MHVWEVELEEKGGRGRRKEEEEGRKKRRERGRGWGKSGEWQTSTVIEKNINKP